MRQKTMYIPVSHESVTFVLGHKHMTSVTKERVETNI